MWYWKSPKCVSRRYFSTSHLACIHLSGFSESVRHGFELYKAYLVFIPEKTAGGPSKISIEWRKGKAYPKIPLFANERRDRQESETLLGANPK